jgi:DNA topoisomerase III
MSSVQQTGQQPLGKCPACGGQIIEGKKGFGCSNWREENGACRFVIWKEIAGQQIAPELLQVLLQGGMTPSMQFRSKEGKEFNACLKLEMDAQQGRWVTRFVFNDQPDSPTDPANTAPEVLGKCPRCGAEVVEGRKGYGCKNWREQDGGCRFVIWKEIAGKRLTPTEVQELLETGATGVIDGFMSRKGKPFSARLKLEGEDHKTVFVF